MTDQVKPRGSRKPKRSCFETACNMLGRRGYAVKEIAGKLAEKGYQPAEITATTARLVDLRLLDDRAFAVGRVRTRLTHSKWGKTRIVRELSDKGVASADITAAFDQFTADEGAPDYLAEATALMLRKFGPLPALDEAGDFTQRQDARKIYEKEQARRLRFLLTKGYSYDQARAALAAATEAAQ